MSPTKNISASFTRGNIWRLAIAISPVFVFALVSVLSHGEYFSQGLTLFSFNAVSATPISTLYLFFERISDFDFLPLYWTSKYSLGTFTNAGFAYFNPFFLISVFFDDFATALVFYSIEMKIIAAAGLFILLRRYGVGQFSATLAAALLPLSGALSTQGQDPQLAYGLCLIPWLLLALEYVLHKRTAAAAGYLALALSALFLVSTIQVYAFYLLYILLPLTVLTVARDRANAGAGLVYLAIGGLAAVLMVGFALSPMLFDLSRSTTAARVGESFSILGTASIILVLSLAIQWSLRTSRRRLKQACLGVLILALVLSVVHVTQLNVTSPNYIFGYLLHGIYDPISQAHLYDFAAQPVRYFFTGPQLAILMIGLIATDWRKGAHGICLNHLGLMGAFFIIFGIGPALLEITYALGGQSPLPFFARFWFFSDLQLIRAQFFGTVSTLVIFALGMDRIVNWIRDRRFRPDLVKVALLAVLGAAVLAEALFVHGQRNYFTDALKYTRVASPEARFLATLSATERVFGFYENEHVLWSEKGIPLDRQAIPRYKIPVYYGANAYSLVGELYKIPEAQQYFNHSTRGTAKGANPEGPINGLLNLAGVRYFVSREHPLDDSLKLVVEGNDYGIYENPNARPRVMLYTDVTFVRAGEKTGHAAAAAGTELTVLEAYLNLGQHGLVLSARDREDFQKEARRIWQLPPVQQSSDESEGQFPATRDQAETLRNAAFTSDAGSVRITRYDDELVEIECRMLKSGVLMISDAYHPGWKASIAGEDVRLFRANYAFRAMLLPAGDYTLVMTFEPPYQWIASLVSALTLIGILGYLLLVRIRGMRRENGFVPSPAGSRM